MVTVEEVLTARQRKEFIDFPIKLYKGSEYYVPMLRSGEKLIFKADYPYNKVCDVVFYNAYKDGKIVGRIQGIIQRMANEKWGQKRVRFTRFDAINDAEVSDALFDAVVNWGKAKGMDELVGPLGYSDLEREGLLIEGFDQPQTFEEQYNYDYYATLIENRGFVKDVDWIEYKLYYPKVYNEKLKTVSNQLMEKFNLKMVRAKSVKEFIEVYAKPVFEMIEITYSKLYGTMPLTDEITDMLINDFKKIVRIKDIVQVLDKDGNVVAFALMFPSVSDAVRKSKGRITIPFFFRFIKAKKHPKVMDLGLIGVRPDYEAKGVAIAMISELIDYMKELKLDYLETNLMLEDNAHIHNILKHFDREQLKRRRCYKLEINGKENK